MPHDVVSTATPTRATRTTAHVSSALVFAGMVCDDYGTAEEDEIKKALVTHLGDYVDGTDAIEETTCDDNDARRQLFAGEEEDASALRRLSTTINIGFTVAVAVEDAGYDSDDTDSLTSDFANTLTSVVSSGAIASSITAQAGNASSFQSATLHTDLSTAVIASSTVTSAVETATRVGPTPAPVTLATGAPSSKSQATTGTEASIVEAASSSTSSPPVLWAVLAALGVVGVLIAVAVYAAVKHQAHNDKKYSVGRSPDSVLTGITAEDDVESHRGSRSQTHAPGRWRLRSPRSSTTILPTGPVPASIEDNNTSESAIVSTLAPATARGLPVVSLVATTAHTVAQPPLPFSSSSEGNHPEAMPHLRPLALPLIEIASPVVVPSPGTRSAPTFVVDVDAEMATTTTTLSHEPRIAMRQNAGAPQPLASVSLAPLPPIHVPVGRLPPQEQELMRRYHDQTPL